MNMIVLSTEADKSLTVAGPTPQPKWRVPSVQTRRNFTQVQFDREFGRDAEYPQVAIGY